MSKMLLSFAGDAKEHGISFFSFGSEPVPEARPRRVRFVPDLGKIAASQ
jgi:hypothetical protein